MTDELKPCPFCGGEATVEFDELGNTNLVHVICTECWASGPACDDGTEKLAWDTRADLAAPKVKPLDLPERRNGYWGHKDGYQVAHTDGDLFRVRFQGRVICRNIPGFDRAVKWANEHHSRRILSALEGHE